MVNASPPAPPALPEEEDGQPWDLSRLVASAAPPPATEEPLPDFSLPPLRQSFPLGEISVAGTTERRRRRSPRRGLQVAVAFCVGAVIALVVSDGEAREPIASMPLDREPAPERAEPTAPVAAAAAPASESHTSVRVEAVGEEAVRPRPRTVVASRGEVGEAPELDVTDEPAPEPAPEPVVAQVPTAIDTERASMDELLDHAVAHVEPLALPTHSGEAEPSEPSAVEEPPAPAGPSRDEVQRVMDALRPALAECAAGVHGLAQVQMSITPNGRARAVRIQGAFAGSPEGSCMAHAARAARFSDHDGDEDVTVRYPYRF